ncbi:MAG: RadC family protein [Sphingomonadaceae bacterium]
MLSPYALAGIELPKAEDKSAEHGGTGHRARLRQRLLEGGAEALADYEVLEYLLFAAFRQGDTKPLAKALLARFGSLASVLNATPGALMQVKGMGETSVGALKSVALAARRMARSEVRQQPVLGSWQALLDYLTIDMAHLTVERVRVLYLDTRNRLVLDDHVGDGSIDEAAIHPREVIRKALDIGSSALILVHNHPSGDPSPSRADIQITQRIAEAGRLLGIVVHDHVIVGREGHTSLRAKGLI